MPPELCLSSGVIKAAFDEEICYLDIISVYKQKRGGQPNTEQKESIEENLRMKVFKQTLGLRKSEFPKFKICS